MIEDAIILLAGFGSRLKPITNNTHKALIQIGKATLLERQINALIKFGIKRFHLSLGYRASDIIQFVNTRFPNLEFEFYENEKYNTTNTGYSVLHVIRSMTKSFWLLDGDVIFDEELLSLFLKHPAQNILLCDTDLSRLDPEAVKFCTNSNNQVIEIGKHISLSLAAGESIGVGQFLSPFNLALSSVLEQGLTHPQNAQWYYEHAFEVMIQNPNPALSLFIESTQPYRWVEIDDAKDLNRAQEWFGR